jgi:hypothetical protein
MQTKDCKIKKCVFRKGFFYTSLDKDILPRASSADKAGIPNYISCRSDDLRSQKYILTGIENLRSIEKDRRLEPNGIWYYGA